MQLQSEFEWQHNFPWLVACFCVNKMYSTKYGRDRYSPVKASKTADIASNALRPFKGQIPWKKGLVFFFILQGCKNDISNAETELKQAQMK